MHAPWRTALALLSQAYPPGKWRRSAASFSRNFSNKIFRHLTNAGVQLNCPVTSSCGRLFDGVSALIGCTREIFYEGQAAIELEQLLNENEQDEKKMYPFTLTASTLPFELDWTSAIRELYQDLGKQTECSLISRKFHAGLVQGLLEMTLAASQKYKVKIVSLSGGCFQNDYLRETLTMKLEQVGLTVLFHKELPCGDGGIALGQAIVADRTYRGEKSCVWQFR